VTAAGVFGLAIPVYLIETRRGDRPRHWMEVVMRKHHDIENLPCFQRHA
jgi:hypothetical protein